MSVITVVQDAMALCGFARPSVVVGSTNAAVAQFEALLRFEATELSKYHDWRSLKVQGQLVGDGVSDEYALPEDFARFALGEVFFVSGLTGQHLRQVTDEQWTAIRAQGFAIGFPLPVWRLFGDMVQFSSPPANGETLTFEFRSSYWISSADQSARRNRWAADDDFFLMPEEVLTQGLVWRFKSAKGLEYAEDFRTYQMQRDVSVAYDKPRSDLKGARSRGRYRDTREAYPGSLG